MFAPSDDKINKHVFTNSLSNEHANYKFYFKIYYRGWKWQFEQIRDADSQYIIVWYTVIFVPRDLKFTNRKAYLKKKMLNNIKINKITLTNDKTHKYNR